jgi:hypothetical protein
MLDTEQQIIEILRNCMVWCVKMSREYVAPLDEDFLDASIIDQ